MKYSFALAALSALQASAYPFVLDDVQKQANVKRQGGGLPNPLPTPGSDAAKALSASRKNCGPFPCVTFNAAEQFVSTSGAHAFQAPGANDIRGLCPGLNAAANHGYLNRNGVQTIPGTITGLFDAYGMQIDLSGFLAAFAVIFNGDPVAGTWSIGGPPPPNLISGGLLGAAQGISYSHNNYEGDVSIGRPDVYLAPDNDPNYLDIERFTSAYDYTETPDRYTLDKFAENFDMKVGESIAQNPYFFSGPFSGLVAPAAYNFVINFMSNRTAEEPNGYLDGAQFKTFFSITGDRGNFVWTPGHERIPENWYKRPSSNQYSAAKVLEDLAVQFLAYPDSFKFGGNTGTTNSFVGFDFGDLTGGAFDNAASLMDPNNLQCFFVQAALAGIPDFATGGLAGPALNLVNKYMKPVMDGANCPANMQIKPDTSKYPGASFKPTPPKKMRMMH